MSYWIVTVTCRVLPCTCFSGPHDRTPLKNHEGKTIVFDLKGAEDMAEYKQRGPGGKHHVYAFERREARP